MLIRKISTLLIATAVTICAAAFAQQAVPKIELISSPCSSKTAARVGVFFSGVTQLNGKPVSLQELTAALKEKSRVTEVCYHRERPESEDAPKQTEQVLNAIIQERLPVSFYWDAQFQKRVHFKE